MVHDAAITDKALVTLDGKIVTITANCHVEGNPEPDVLRRLLEENL
jgi:hypothetical protein